VLISAGFFWPAFYFCERLSTLLSCSCNDTDFPDNPSQTSFFALVLQTGAQHTSCMKNECGFTLIETMVAIALVVTLGATGLYGWQSWQEQQRLWQAAHQIRDYLMEVRSDANNHNRDHSVVQRSDGQGGCLTISTILDCHSGGALVLQAIWPDVIVAEITPSLTFYGRNDTAWAGHIRVRSRAGEWLIIVSNLGRIRMCNSTGQDTCQ